MSEDIGESLVGAYLRYVRGCEFVLFNTYLPGEQGEIDVIGIRLGEPRTPREVYFAEVTTHLEGMDYGGNQATVRKVTEKLERAGRFARHRFPDDQHRFQVWSPRVARGAMTSEFDALADRYVTEGGRLEFMINDRYADAVQELVDVARSDKRATNDPAYRLLQVLSRLRTSDGTPLRFDPPPRGAAAGSQSSAVDEDP